MLYKSEHSENKRDRNKSLNDQTEDLPNRCEAFFTPDLISILSNVSAQRLPKKKGDIRW